MRYPTPPLPPPPDRKALLREYARASRIKRAHERIDRTVARGTKVGLAKFLHTCVDGGATDVVIENLLINWTRGAHQ